MKSQPAASIDCVITSPPYNLNIAYGCYKDKMPANDYLSWLREVFVEIQRILTDDGHFFLNAGYSNISPWIGIDIANVARDVFTLQNNITWVKSIYVDGKTTGHFKPINSKRFSNPTWEHLFHFTKDGNVPVDRLAVGVHYEWADNLKRFNVDQNLRCRGNCWFVPYKTIKSRNKNRGQHPATFPEELAEMCIRFAGLKQGSVVYDPFVGTGTTVVAAVRCGMEGIGTDIDNDYLQFAEQRAVCYVCAMPFRDVSHCFEGIWRKMRYIMSPPL